MEDDHKKIKMEEDLKKNGRRPQKKGSKEDDLKKKWNGRRPHAQFKKSTLIGCDIIVNQTNVI